MEIKVRDKRLKRKDKRLEAVEKQGRWQISETRTKSSVVQEKSIVSQPHPPQPCTDLYDMYVYCLRIIIYHIAF